MYVHLQDIKHGNLGGVGGMTYQPFISITVQLPYREPASPFARASGVLFGKEYDQYASR